MCIVNRLIKYIEYKGLTVNKFASNIGVSNAYFSKMAKNNGSIGSNILEKIVSDCPDLNLYWLLNGEGDMMKKNKDMGSCAEHEKKIIELQNELIEAQKLIIDLMKKNV